jgi:biotin carboxyl carrier protein
MGGVVASIAVKEGQAVSQGDRIAELEAMKMKVPVMAGCSGKVTRIAVAVGDAVESGQVLVVIA